MGKPDWKNVAGQFKNQLDAWDAKTPETGDITIDSTRKDIAAFAAIGGVKIEALSDIERALDLVFPGEIRMRTRDAAAKFDTNFDPEGTLVNPAAREAIRAALLSNDFEQED